MASYCNSRGRRGSFWARPGRPTIYAGVEIVRSTSRDSYCAQVINVAQGVAKKDLRGAGSTNAAFMSSTHSGT